MIDYNKIEVLAKNIIRNILTILFKNSIEHRLVDHTLVRLVEYKT